MDIYDVAHRDRDTRSLSRNNTFRSALAFTDLNQFDRYVLGVKFGADVLTNLIGTCS